MADETPASSAQTDIDTTPAVATPKPTVPNADAVMAKIRAAARAAEAEKAAEKPKEADDGKKLAADSKILRELGKKQAELRAVEARIRELEPLKSDADFMREVRGLWEKGGDDRLAALAKLSGKDGTDVLAEMMAQFYAKEQDAAADPAKAAPAPEMKALLGVVEELRKELAEIKSGKATDAEATAKAAAEAEKKAGDAFVARFLGEHKADFEISSRPENVAEATSLIHAAAVAIAKRDKVDAKSMTQEQADAIYLEATQEVESEFENTGKRFSKQSRQDVPVFDPDKYRKFARSAPAAVVKPVTLSKNPAEREQQVRAKLRAKYGG
jgi:hypothetical protein